MDAKVETCLSVTYVVTREREEVFYMYSYEPEECLEPTMRLLRWAYPDATCSVTVKHPR